MNTAFLSKTLFLVLSTILYANHAQASLRAIINNRNNKHNDNNASIVIENNDKMTIDNKIIQANRELAPTTTFQAESTIFATGPDVTECGLDEINKIKMYVGSKMNGLFSLDPKFGDIQVVEMHTTAVSLSEDNERSLVVDHVEDKKNDEVIEEGTKKNDRELQSRFRGGFTSMVFMEGQCRGCGPDDDLIPDPLEHIGTRALRMLSGDGSSSSTFLSYLELLVQEYVDSGAVPCFPPESDIKLVFRGKA
mmetsp:Transcript_11526/g.17618  ORF Transcript_11526/g.17618 Transcript_11526/m.17618 type:complete len:250 (-) Transcript_11526:19-768(-)